MPTKLSTGKVRRVYEFIKENRNQYDVKMMCRVLEVTRSGYSRRKSTGIERLHTPTFRNTSNLSTIRLGATVT